MDIELTRLRGVEVPVQGDFNLSETEGSSQEERRSLREHGVHFDGPMHVEALAQCSRSHAGGEEFVITGTVRGQLTLSCSRCLCSMKRAVDLEFRSRFAIVDENASARGQDLDENEDGEGEMGLRVAAGDLDLSFLPAGASTISLDEVVREQVLLDVPSRPLCSTDCEGLCDQCGAVLAQGECTCDRTLSQTDIRLAPLAELKKRFEGK